MELIDITYILNNYDEDERRMRSFQAASPNCWLLRLDNATSENKCQLWLDDSENGFCSLGFERLRLTAVLPPGRYIPVPPWRILSILTPEDWNP